MRPVTKVDPEAVPPDLDAYPFYTDPSLDEPQDFQADTYVSKAYTGNDDDEYATTVRQIQLDLLGWKISNPRVNPFVVQADAATKKAVEALIDRLTTLYRDANPHLVNQLGGYCSFCEIQMAALDVEHVLPKSLYPLRFVLWENFLLACKTCNPIKGTKPPRASAIGWAGGGNPAEEAIMTAAVDHYFWPERDADSFRRLSYPFCDAEDGYAVIHMASAASLHNKYVGTVGNAVRADVQLAALAAVTANHRVEVKVGRSDVGDAAKTQAQLDLVGLERTADRRAASRTKTWFRVLSSVRTIREIPADDTAEEKRTMFALSWKLFMEAAQSWGHYSTLVTVLREFDDPDYLDPRLDSLAHRFVRDSAPANANARPLEVYAGTNTDEVP